MFNKLKAFFSGRLNESGALPAIMAGSILISATAVLLAGFSVTVTRNAEINSVKTNVNYYLNACEAILETETYKTFPSKFDTETKQKIKDRIANGDCNGTKVNGVPQVTIKLARDPELYIPTGETYATSVKVTLTVDIAKGAFKSTGYTESLRYLEYAERVDTILTPSSYIKSFDVNGNAVWITP